MRATERQLPNWQEMAVRADSYPRRTLLGHATLLRLHSRMTSYGRFSLKARRVIELGWGLPRERRLKPTCTPNLLDDRNRVERTIRLVHASEVRPHLR